MASIKALIAAAEEAAKEKRSSRAVEKVFEPSDPKAFPRVPKGSGKNEDIRLEMRERGKNDVYFLCKVILGYEKLRPEPHGELCAFLDQTESFNRRIIYMPRDTFKTTIATITKNIQRVLRDPEIRILIVADTSDNASRFMIEIGNQMRYNMLFQWLYPEIIPESFSSIRWNTKEIVVKRSKPWREPTIDAMGAGAGIESRHYDHIGCDDLVTEKHLHSDTEMDKLIKWFPGLESLLVNDVESTIEFVGSRKKKGDAYEAIEKYFGAADEEHENIGPHAERRGEVAVYHRSIRNEDGSIIFPYDSTKKSGISEKFLIRMRTYDPERYHAQYENNPKGTGLTTFRLEDMRYFGISESGLIEAVHDGKLVERVSVWGLQRIVFYDPSVAEKKTSSKQGIIVVAKGSGPNRYVLEALIGHFPPDEAIQMLFEMNKKWRPELFSIEKRGFQGWIKYNLNEISEMQGLPYLPVVEYPPEGSEKAQWAKPEHIRALQPIVRSHMLWAQKDQHELLEEIEFYPNVRWDDGLDALAQGLEYWPLSMDEQEVAAIKEREAVMLDAALPERFRVMMQSTSGRQVAREVRPFSEEEFLAQFDATGYGFKSFNN